MIDIIPDDLSCINSDTCELSDTDEAPHNYDDDLDDLSDEDGNDDPDDTSKSNYLLRNLHSDLNGEAWESSYGHMVSAMMVVEQVGVRMMKEYSKSKCQKQHPTMDSGRD